MLTGLSNQQIVSMLKGHTLWCKKACRQIISKPHDFIPLLIDILDKTIADAELTDDDIEEHHIPAAMLLAQIREPQAYPKLIKLINYDQKTVDMIWGDFLAQWYSLVLRDTFNGDTSLLIKLIEDRYCAPWSRVMALDALTLLQLDGHISLEEIAGFFRRLIHEVYTEKPNDDDEEVFRESH